jgi:short-subunit dehydrogenase
MIRELTGSAALVTGCSQGLGPFIARVLAAEGVRLAIAARSRPKLEAVARAIAATGATCVPIAADVTSDADRTRLVDEASRAIGPIDLLVNNAGVEHGGSFVRRSAAEIEQLISTNIAAPMLLTRLLLPEMIERRRGHIVNIASIAGKLGYPFASVYGGTKAAIITWSSALRVELEGTGVSVTVVSPGYVKGAGMFDDHYVKPPAALSETTPDAVAAGVLRALREDPIEVVVAGRPFWPVHALYTVAPRPVLGLFRRLGLFDYMRRMLDGD